MSSSAGEPAPKPCDVSVCIVNWNSRALLDELLESLRTECGQIGLETIVVDNHSGDDSAAMVQRKYPQVRLVRNQTNAGFSRANNQAAALASGRYLLFLNNDTRVHGGAVAALASYLDTHADVVAVGPKLVFADGRFQPSCRRLPTRGLLLGRLRMFGWSGHFKKSGREHLMQDIDPARQQQVEMIIGAALMVRRDAFVACGGWDESFHFCLEDADLGLRLAKRGRLMFVPQAVVVHHGSISAHANFTYTFRNLELGYARYVGKHGRHKWSAPLYKLLVTADLPLWIAALMIRIGRYRIIGQREKLPRAKAHLKAVVRFALRDLPRYWWT